MIMVTFTKLFVIRIVANKRSLLSSRLLIFSSEGCFLSAIAFRSDGEREKKAISEADAKPETSKSKPANTMATTAEIEGVCTDIPLKHLPTGINKRLGPKILVLVKQLERQVVRRVILCRGSLRLYWLLWLGGGSRLRRIRASTGSCRSRSQHLHIVDNISVT